MNTHADKTLENKSQTVANRLPKLQSKSESTFQFVDNRPEAIAQRKLQEAISNSPRVQQLKAYQEMANNSPQVSQLRAIQDRANNSPQFSKTAQLQAMADNHSAQQQQPIQKKKNNTGLPDNLKTGMENLSGMSLDDVKVHRNSDKPAQLQAHAYAQGTDIHLGPGQEKHLSHEAWHVVQQKQGRVKPTMQMMGKVDVNDDTGLEKEADVMGAEALQMKVNSVLPTSITAVDHSSTVQRVVYKGFPEYEEKAKEINEFHFLASDLFEKFYKREAGVSELEVLLVKLASISVDGFSVHKQNYLLDLILQNVDIIEGFIEEAKEEVGEREDVTLDYDSKIDYEQYDAQEQSRKKAGTSHVFDEKPPLIRQGAQRNPELPKMEKPGYIETRVEEFREDWREKYSKVHPYLPKASEWLDDQINDSLSDSKISPKNADGKAAYSKGTVNKNIVIGAISGIGAYADGKELADGYKDLSPENIKDDVEVSIKSIKGLIDHAKNLENFNVFEKCFDALAALDIFGVNNLLSSITYFFTAKREKAKLKVLEKFSTTPMGDTKIGGKKESFNPTDFVKWSIEKIKRSFITSIFKGVSSLMQAIARWTTIASGFLLAPVTESIKLLAKAVTVSETAFRNVKGMIKYFKGTKGVARKENASEIYDRVRLGHRPTMLFLDDFFEVGIGSIQKMNFDAHVFAAKEDAKQKGLELESFHEIFVYIDTHKDKNPKFKLARKYIIDFLANMFKSQPPAAGSSIVNLALQHPQLQSLIEEQGE